MTGILGWIDAHSWVVAAVIFGLWPVARWLFVERTRAGQVTLSSQISALAEGLGKAQGELIDLRSRFALHRQEDATAHAKVDGELAIIRERLAALPTARDMGRIEQAIERMRAEVCMQISAVQGDVKVVETRVGDVRDMMDRTQIAVDRHEQIISDAAARHRG
jgi:hypothetical protein